MEQNAFSEGIAPGGLRDRAEIKLLVCYLLKKVDGPLTQSMINDILQECSVANYFEVNQAISELTEKGTVQTKEQDGQTFFSLLPQTYYYVGEIERSLPRSVRERAVSSAIKVMKRSRIERETNTEIEKLDQGYNVTFEVNDAGTQLLKVTIYVSDISQVELVKRNFYNNAVDICSNIISSLTVE